MSDVPAVSSAALTKVGAVVSPPGTVEPLSTVVAGSVAASLPAMS